MIENVSINSIILYSQKSFPNEACGFVLDNGSIYPAHNVIDKLCDPSINSKNAFLIDDDSWKIVSSRNNSIVGIYHSHNNGIADMSPADVEFLKWPGLFYVIIALTDHNPIAAKLFWWDNIKLCESFLNLPIKDKNENTEYK